MDKPTLNDFSTADNHVDFDAYEAAKLEYYRYRKKVREEGRRMGRPPKVSNENAAKLTEAYFVKNQRGDALEAFARDELGLKVSTPTLYATITRFAQGSDKFKGCRPTQPGGNPLFNDYQAMLLARAKAESGLTPRKIQRMLTERFGAEPSKSLVKNTLKRGKAILESRGEL